MSILVPKTPSRSETPERRFAIPPAPSTLPPRARNVADLLNAAAMSSRTATSASATVIRSPQHRPPPPQQAPAAAAQMHPTAPSYASASLHYVQPLEAVAYAQEYVPPPPPAPFQRPPSQSQERTAAQRAWSSSSEPAPSRGRPPPPQPVLSAAQSTQHNHNHYIEDGAKVYLQVFENTALYPPPHHTAVRLFPTSTTTDGSSTTEPGSGPLFRKMNSDTKFSRLLKGLLQTLNDHHTQQQQQQQQEQCHLNATYTAFPLLASQCVLTVRGTGQLVDPAATPAQLAAYAPGGESEEAPLALMLSIYPPSNQPKEGSSGGPPPWRSGSAASGGYDSVGPLTPVEREQFSGSQDCGVGRARSGSAATAAPSAHLRPASVPAPTVIPPPQSAHQQQPQMAAAATPLVSQRAPQSRPVPQQHEAPSAVQPPRRAVSTPPVLVTAHSQQQQQQQQQQLQQQGPAAFHPHVNFLRGVGVAEAEERRGDTSFASGATPHHHSSPHHSRRVPDLSMKGPRTVESRETPSRRLHEPRTSLDTIKAHVPWPSDKPFATALPAKAPKFTTPMKLVMDSSRRGGRPEQAADDTAPDTSWLHVNAHPHHHHHHQGTPADGSQHVAAVPSGPGGGGPGGRTANKRRTHHETSSLMAAFGANTSSSTVDAGRPRPSSPRRTTLVHDRRDGAMEAQPTKHAHHHAQHHQHASHSSPHQSRYQTPQTHSQVRSAGHHHGEEHAKKRPSQPSIGSAPQSQQHSSQAPLQDEISKALALLRNQERSHTTTANRRSTIRPTDSSSSDDDSSNSSSSGSDDDVPPPPPAVPLSSAGLLSAGYSRAAQRNNLNAGSGGTAPVEATVRSAGRAKGELDQYFSARHASSSGYHRHQHHPQQQHPSRSPSAASTAGESPRRWSALPSGASIGGGGDDVEDLHRRMMEDLRRSRQEHGRRPATSLSYR